MEEIIAVILDEAVLGGTPRILTWLQIIGGFLTSATVAFGLIFHQAFDHWSFRWAVCVIGFGGVIYGFGFLTGEIVAIKVGVAAFGFGTTALLIGEMFRDANARKRP